MKKIAAIICEYDPFHNGHKYLIEETRRRTECDGVVCIMSGSFTQRGQPAICDKWLRAEAALLGGADIVIELPFYYAVASAQYFGTGGVNAAAALGADAVAFGSETAALGAGGVALGSETAALGSGEVALGSETVEEILRRLAGARLEPGFGAAVKRAIDAGASYAAAATAASLNTGTDPNSDFLNMGTDPRIGPNDILGAEYIAAAARMGYEPEWCIVPREGAGHGAELPVDRYASATFLRAQLAYDDWDARISPFVPETTLELLKKWRETEQFVTTDAFSTAVTAVLRGAEAELTEKLPFGGGGVGRLVHKNAQKYAEWGQIVRASTSARYQSSRISRLLVHALVSLNSKGRLTKAETARVYGRGAMPYVRVLGIREGNGQAMLSELSKRLKPGTALVTSPADYLNGFEAGDRPRNNTLGAKMLRADIRAQAVYNSALRGVDRTAADRDLTQKMLRI
jgi:predicted nucleotidyltransferase